MPAREKLSVCVVTPFCETGAGGGIATHLRLTAAALVRAGFSVSVISGRRSVEPAPIDGARLELVEGPADTFSPGFWEASRAAFLRLRAERAFDVVLSEGSSAFGLLDEGLPVVGLAHQFKGAHLLNSWLEVDGPRTLLVYALGTIPRALRTAWTQERPFFRRCRAVLCGAEHMARRLEKAYGLAKVTVVPNWVSMGHWTRAASARASGRRRWGLADGEFAFLVLGRLQPTKGCADAVDAFLRAFPSDPKARLVVAGAGTSAEASALRARASSDPRIVVAGEVAEEELREAYQAADAFVMPSRLLEVLPYSLLEAMASGLPCLASDRPGNREALGELGLFYPSADVPALAEGLRRLRSDASLRGLGEASMRRAAERFSEEACAPRLIAAVLGAAGASP